MSDDASSEFSQAEILLESTLESVDRAEAEVLRVAQTCGMVEDDQLRLGMAVRESVVNAVVHGNRYNSHKRVHLRIARSRESLQVEIADEGEGFELSSVPDPLAQENLLRQSGRGILLIQAFVDEFRVKRGPSTGTEVRLVKYLNREP
ncbi:MAG: ATP-binding protein [Acidobacteria bacterium]|nr:ATP-binding protein [Acidobacteriota bacterium]